MVIILHASFARSAISCLLRRLILDLTRWGVGGGEGSCGKRYGAGKERCVGRGVESVWGEWGSVLACGVGVWGEEWEGVGKCVRV